MEELPHLRRDYRRADLEETDVAADPIAQFCVWLEEAVEATGRGAAEANAMVLATADAGGRPSARTVLLKGVDARGFVFFTNRRSRKATDIAANPQVALLFRWDPLERQICVTGRAETLPDEESDAYFASRPTGNRLTAWASPQSAVVESRPVLEAWFEQTRDRFSVAVDEADVAAVPRPPFWGGYVVVPETVELWQGRPNRLHDRLRYRRSNTGWELERLAP